MQTTLRRKNRSSRNCPSATATLEIAIGGGDDPDVDAHVVAAAEPRELAVLQHLQQLRLQRRLHLADLVEEHRAVVGELELARLVLDGAGERAALEPEQLRFEQLRGQRRAVDLDERLVPPRRGADGCARATSSLPVPLSPRISTVTSVSATRSIRSLDLAHLLVAAEQHAGDARRAAVTRAGADRSSAVSMRESSWSLMPGSPPRSTAAGCSTSQPAVEQGECHEWKCFRNVRKSTELCGRTAAVGSAGNRQAVEGDYPEEVKSRVERERDGVILPRFVHVRLG